MQNWNSYVVGGNAKQYTVTPEDSFAVSQKVKDLPNDLAIPLLRI